MERRLRVRHVGALLVVLGALSLSGCASNTPIDDFPGVPLVPVAAEAADEEGAEGEEAEPELEEVEVPEGEPSAVYLDYGDRLAVILWGSSTCPPVASHVVVTQDAGSGNSVRVDVEPLPEDAICTADLVPHTTVFGTPQSITTTLPLTMDIDGQEFVLPVK